MIWLLLALTLLVIAAAGWWVARPRPERPPRDPDWGDWPNDQRMP